MLALFLKSTLTTFKGEIHLIIHHLTSSAIQPVPFWFLPAGHFLFNFHGPGSWSKFRSRIWNGHIGCLAKSVPSPRLLIKVSLKVSFGDAHLLKVCDFAPYPNSTSKLSLTSVQQRYHVNPTSFSVWVIVIGRTESFYRFRLIISNEHSFVHTQPFPHVESCCARRVAVNEEH